MTQITLSENQMNEVAYAISEVLMKNYEDGQYEKFEVEVALDDTTTIYAEGEVSYEFERNWNEVDGFVEYDVMEVTRTELIDLSVEYYDDEVGELAITNLSEVETYVNDNL